MLLNLGFTDTPLSKHQQHKMLRLFHHHPWFQNPAIFKNHPASFVMDDRAPNSTDRWRAFRTTPDQEMTVKDLTQFLEEAGFMVDANHDGIFGYATQAAVRLFQEYVRTQDKDYDPGSQPAVYPDGVVGNDTLSHIKRWQASKQKCDWSANSGSNSSEYDQWLKDLKSIKKAMIDEPTPMLDLLNHNRRKTDSLPASDWEFDENLPQLIGIRRNAEKRRRTRPNDDLFFLLLNGKVFTFWGSTDANPSLASRSDEAYLVDGQHRYVFSWHGFKKNKVYRAMRPARHGVSVIRDRKNTNSLSSGNVKKGLARKTVDHINIHWSGEGGFNFSAGCQVIGGRSYRNQHEDIIDCSDFAARNKTQLGKRLGGKFRKTKAAYNVLADLLLIYGPKGTVDKVPEIRYTLLSEDILVNAGLRKSVDLQETLDNLQRVR